MKHFDTRVYAVSDFLEWSNSDLLQLSPDFQRRSVWSRNAKSYLIDTIIRGKPIPKILISQKLSGSRTIRVVVDGQQRLRAILEYIDGDFNLSRAHNKEYANLGFADLPDDVKSSFLKYELGVDLLFEMSYEDVLDIFARINTYTVTLNKQEKRNAKYVGYFKQFAYEYGYKYVRYFGDASILTKRAITRMAEAELSAELFVALIDGIQTNKNTEHFYKKYEDDIGNLEEASSKFDTIMSYIAAIYPPADLSRTNWSRIHLFYTLFTAVGHNLYGLTGPKEELRVQVDKKSVGKLRVLLDDLSNRYDAASQDLDSAPRDLREFIDYSRRRTTDTAARIARANFVCKEIEKALG